MKAKTHRASQYDGYWIEEINNLRDLLKILDKGGRIILERNDSYKSKPYPNRAKWEEEKRQGLHDCELEILIYDDYIE